MKKKMIKRDILEQLLNHNRAILRADLERIGFLEQMNTRFERAGIRHQQFVSLKIVKVKWHQQYNFSECELENPSKWGLSIEVIVQGRKVRKGQVVFLNYANWDMGYKRFTIR